MAIPPRTSGTGARDRRGCPFQRTFVLRGSERIRRLLCLRTPALSICPGEIETANDEHVPAQNISVLNLHACGAVRLLREKRGISSKKRVAAANPAVLIVRDGDDSAAQTCSPDGPARISPKWLGPRSLEPRSAGPTATGAEHFEDGYLF